MGSIYKITNTVNEKSYIGQTRHDAVKGRIRDHLTGSPKGSKLIKFAIAKYGRDAFIDDILHDGIIPELLDNYEIEAIKSHNTLAPNGYNLTTGGSNGRPSDETRRNMSKAHKGKKLSAETRRRMSESRKGENHPFYGKPHSAEARDKISKAKRGKTYSAETRKKISNTTKGERNPMYGRTGEKSPMYGKRHSAETRRKLSEAKKGEKNPIYGKKPHNYGKRHPCYDFAKDLFFSLPTDTPRREKRKKLYEAFPEVLQSTIRRWVREDWT